MENKPLRLRLKRTNREDGFTMGVLTIGRRFVARTLEPQWRDLHHEPYIRGQTALPEGTYQVRLQLSPRHKCLMPTIVGAPAEFEEVMIQSGSFVTDCEGGILVGEWFDNYGVLRNTLFMFGQLLLRLFAANFAEQKIIICITNK